MALSRRRDGHQGAGPWPGYVDVLSTLLMVIVFVLAVFMLVQFFLANAISGRDKAIEGLRSELAGLIDQLNLEKRNNAQLRLDLTNLQATLTSANAEREGEILWQWNDEVEPALHKLFEMMFFLQIIPEIPAIKLWGRDPVE